MEKLDKAFFDVNFEVDPINSTILIAHNSNCLLVVTDFVKKQNEDSSYQAKLGWVSVSAVDSVISRGFKVVEKTLLIRLMKQLLKLDDITDDGDVMYIKSR